MKKPSEHLYNAAVYVALKPADIVNKNDLAGFVLTGIVTSILTLPITIPMCLVAGALEKRGW